MRGFVAALIAAGAVFTVLPAQASAQSTPAAQRSLSRSLRRELKAGGRHEGALVVDMTTGQTLYSASATVGRLPASVEKIYTTSTALLRFGADTRLSTRVLGVGSYLNGSWNGTLYLKGGGDPTFGSSTFDHRSYGTGATMQQLVTHFVRSTGITSITGAVVGDESYFDSLRGTPPYGFHSSFEIEGQLSALSYDRGFTSLAETAFQHRPALYATQQFVSALKAAGVKVASGTKVYTGYVPSDATQLASVNSPRIGWLIKLTNTPSDNYLAEMLLKGIGAGFGGAGTTAAGAAVVRSEMATFGIHPRLDDGSGLSRSDSTSPAQVVTALEKMAGNPDFTNSLAIGGRTGTLSHEMRGTRAQNNCIGKTGTLRDVASLAGYCTARDGHRLVFAFLMNSLGNPDYGHELEANMAASLAKYDG